MLLRLFLLLISTMMTLMMMMMMMKLKKKTMMVMMTRCGVMAGAGGRERMKYLGVTMHMSAAYPPQYDCWQPRVTFASANRGSY